MEYLLSDQTKRSQRSEVTWKFSKKPVFLRRAAKSIGIVDDVTQLSLPEEKISISDEGATLRKKEEAQFTFQNCKWMNALSATKAH